MVPLNPWIGVGMSHKAGADDCPKNSRREVLQRGGRWLWAVVVLAILYPVLRFVKFSAPRKPVKIRVEKDLQPGGFYIGAKFIVFADERGEVRALSRICTHLGCLISYNETKKQLICPCHQSRFSKRGKRMFGPAKHDLPSYKITKAGKGRTGYVVTL